MANYVKKIRTDKGDLQIDYNDLANLPDLGTFDTKLTDMQTKLNGKANTTDVSNIQAELSALKTTVDGKAEATDLQAAKTEFLADITEVEYSLGTIPLQYVKRAQWDKVVDEASDGTLTISADALPGYVTEEQLTTNLIATETTPGVVKPGKGLSVSANGTLSVDSHKHYLDNLIDVKVCDQMPDTSEILDGYWYLVKAEE